MQGFTNGDSGADEFDDFGNAFGGGLSARAELKRTGSVKVEKNVSEEDSEDLVEFVDGDADTAGRDQR